MLLQAYPGQLHERISKTEAAEIFKIKTQEQFRVVKVINVQSSQCLQMIQKILLDRLESKNISHRNCSIVWMDKQRLQLFVQYFYYPHSCIFSAYEPKKIPQIRAILISSFIQKTFRCKPLYFCTYQNTFCNKKTDEIMFNPLSTVGLLSIITRRYFRKRQFKEVYQLLDEQMLNEQVQGRQMLVTYRSKYRAIAMSILHLILEKRVSLLKQEDNLPDQVDFKLAKQLLAKIPKRFKKLLKENEVYEKIQKAEQDDQVHYINFLQRVFHDNCKDLQWKQVVSLLFCQQKQKRQQVDLSECLDSLSKGLFLGEDNCIKRFLIQMGIAQDITKSHINTKYPVIELIEPGLYLHLLLENASFKFNSIAAQISQQAHKNLNNPIEFQSLTKLIDKCRSVLMKGKSCIQLPKTDSKLFTVLENILEDRSVLFSLLQNHYQNQIPAYIKKSHPQDDSVKVETIKTIIPYFEGNCSKNKMIKKYLSL